MDVERWAEINGYPGYAVSDQGRVMNQKLNRIIEGKEHGNRRRVAIKSEEGYFHDYSTEKLMEMVDFESGSDSVVTRKIRIVETEQVFSNVKDVADALMLYSSDIYKALNDPNRTVAGVHIEYFMG